MEQHEPFIPQGTGSWPPWGRGPGLKEMTQEVGIDFDQFIECLRLNRTDAEMAVEFDVSEKTITCLRNHFERYGLDSVMGGD